MRRRFKHDRSNVELKASGQRPLMRPVTGVLDLKDVRRVRIKAVEFEVAVIVGRG
jgi:hypothetical protein